MVSVEEYLEEDSKNGAQKYSLTCVVHGRQDAAMVSYVSKDDKQLLCHVCWEHFIRKQCQPLTITEVKE